MSKSGLIKLRVKQGYHPQFIDSNVQIFAPLWVEKALETLLPAFEGAVFKVEGSDKPIKIQGKIPLQILIAIARSEESNVTGVIAFEQYNGISREAIIALRDIVKHCVMVGKDRATHFGGYPQNGNKPQKLGKDVYIIDLPGLQFQELNNTGRHVLLSKEDTLPKGLLDETIFNKTVGQSKASFKEAQKDKTGRFISGSFIGEQVLFDSYAYHAFVAQDFLLSAQALIAQAQEGESLNFKFLKYGAGFFAENLEGEAKDKLSYHLAMGIMKGVQRLFDAPASKRQNIKRIELPFFNPEADKEVAKTLKQIKALCELNSIEFSSTNDDALAQTSKYITATTNCSDPHAPTGNEMNFGSVDAAIAENLEKKGNNFSPICNPDMKAKFITVPHLKNGKLPLFSYVASATMEEKYSHKKKIISTGVMASIIGYSTYLSLRLSFGIGLVATGLMLAIDHVRELIKKQRYERYREKSSADLNNLSKVQLEAFEIGTKACFSYSDQLWSFVSASAWRAPGDYYAGIKAAEMQDHTLISSVESLKKPKP